MKKKIEKRKENEGPIYSTITENECYT